MRPASTSSHRPLVALLALALAAGCGGDDDSFDDPDGGGSAADAAVADDCAGETGCNGPCELGNSFGVGRYCTAGGGECAGSKATFCTVDFNPTDLAFCTRPCADDSQCGEDATCRSKDGSGPMGCVPNFCLSPGELDAGSEDGGTGDAGRDGGPAPDAVAG
jgi:hypothetical protein